MKNKKNKKRVKRRRENKVVRRGGGIGEGEDGNDREEVKTINYFFSYF